MCINYDHCERWKTRLDRFQSPTCPRALSRGGKKHSTRGTDRKKFNDVLDRGWVGRGRRVGEEITAVKHSLTSTGRTRRIRVSGRPCRRFAHCILILSVCVEKMSVSSSPPPRRISQYNRNVWFDIDDDGKNRTKTRNVNPAADGDPTASPRRRFKSTVPRERCFYARSSEKRQTRTTVPLSAGDN